MRGTEDPKRYEIMTLVHLLPRTPIHKKKKERSEHVRETQAAGVCDTNQHPVLRGHCTCPHPSPSEHAAKEGWWHDRRWLPGTQPTPIPLLHHPFCTHTHHDHQVSVHPYCQTAFQGQVLISTVSQDHSRGREHSPCSLLEPREQGAERREGTRDRDREHGHTQTSGNRPSN